jgi:hypothetical protein
VLNTDRTRSPEAWPRLRPLIGIRSQATAPSRAIFADPVQRTFWRGVDRMDPELPRGQRAAVQLVHRLCRAGAANLAV